MRQVYNLLDNFSGMPDIYSAIFQHLYLSEFENMTFRDDAKNFCSAGRIDLKGELTKMRKSLCNQRDHVDLEYQRSKLLVDKITESIFDSIEEGSGIPKESEEERRIKEVHTTNIIKMVKIENCIERIDISLADF